MPDGSQRFTRPPEIMKFVSHTLIAAVALGSSFLHADPIPEELRQNGWFIGCQAYTFKEFSAFEAIAKTKEAGGNMIEFYPGQILKPGSKVKVHHNMPEEAREELLAECKRQGVHAVNYGVVGARSEKDVEEIMAFADKMGLYSVCTEAAEQVVAWEKAAKKYDVKVAFHEHGGSMKNPNYKVWHPLYILGVVESRDERLGACADLGHWCTSKMEPVDCLRILDGRIVSVHFKDKEAMGPSKVVRAGEGVVDNKACLEELKKQGFDGHISIEHEANWKDNVEDVRHNIDFIKANAK